MKKNNSKYIYLLIYLFCILMMLLYSMKKCISIYPKENIFIYIISVLCIICFLKEQSIKKNIIIIYINTVFFSIVFIYNCLINTTLSIPGISEEAVALLYDLIENIFGDITKFFMVYFFISTILLFFIIVKKYIKKNKE